MAVILGIAALAIDVSQWYAARHQAQITADAAALAAANCEASGQCTTNSAAQTVAISYASKNGATITASNVTFPTSSTVEVTVPAQEGNSLSSAVGVTPQTHSESAVASWTSSTSQCTPSSGNCAAIFAMASPSGSSCPTDITLNGAGDTITGSVHANGTISESGGDQTLGTTSYGLTADGCSYQPSSGSTPATGTSEAPITSWPTDYSKVLTACGGTGQPTCTGPCINSGDLTTDPCTPPVGGTTDNCESSSDGCSGTPAYCTQGAASYDFGNGEAALPTDNVWCAFGTGSPTNPADYTGLIYFQSGTLGTSTTPIYGTWIGGTVEVGHKSYLSTQASTPTYPVFYSAGSGTCSSASSGGVCMSASGNQINGDIFAPNGAIEFDGAGSTFNFLEAQTIDFVGGSAGFTGDGPSSAGGGSTAGTDSLTQ
jgi:Flp pilus assembly protein TadG